MSVFFTNKRKFLSLRSFITLVISAIVTMILLYSVLFFYKKTSDTLKHNYEQSITSQLNQVNQQINEQIDMIDSTIPIFLSNTVTLDTLESALQAPISVDHKLNIQRQMAYIYYSTTLSNKNFVNSIHIFSDEGTDFSLFTSGSSEKNLAQSREIIDTTGSTESQLMCRVLPNDERTLFLVRNLYSSNTGNHMATFVANIDRSKWLSFCSKGLDPSWFICLYDNENLSLVSNTSMQKQAEALKKYIGPKKEFVPFQEQPLGDDMYFIAASELTAIHAVSSVAAPRDLLLRDLNNTLKSYMRILALVLLLALLAAILISRAVTRPIDKMVYQIEQISQGRQSSLPPMKVYREFQTFADAFNQMLKQLDVYYNDNFQKQLLLKNAEIRALQSQMDPHFLFNVLNTIAWKAQMYDNEEIYQMVISLSELLRSNILSKETSVISLEKEIEYVKFYIYLQQMRFEDKISCNIQIPTSLLSCKIPCFCIQPLVENAIVHGLEPKKGKGKLSIHIFQCETYMEVSINDNGVGFEEIPDLQKISSSDEDAHTHIGLKNLDKRLELLYGPISRLQITSTPSVCTSVSFRLPLDSESPI